MKNIVSLKKLRMLLKKSTVSYKGYESKSATVDAALHDVHFLHDLERRLKVDTGALFSKEVWENAKGGVAI